MQDNNLWIADITTMQYIQITFDGKLGEIFYGTPDWVYRDGYPNVVWNEDCSHIAYVRLDDRNIPERKFVTFREGQAYPNFYSARVPEVSNLSAFVTFW